MKTLIFNGCSLMAGDAIVWEEYIDTIGYNGDSSWSTFHRDKNGVIDNNEEKLKIFWDYRFNYRRTRNLPAILANKLESDFVDLSEDGNSNDAIVITTINFLLKVPKVLRKNYHVIIGWTSPYRSLKWNTQYSLYENVIFNVVVPDHKKFIESMVSLDDEDHYLSFMKNLILLENFLIANDCTYTFYKAMGSILEFKDKKLYPINDSIESNKIPPDDINYTDQSCWYKFDSTIPTFKGNSFHKTYLGLNDKWRWISPDNCHPNLKLIELFSSHLFTFIKGQGVGF